MKRLYITGLILALLTCASMGFSQNTVRRTPPPVQPQSKPQPQKPPAQPSAQPQVQQAQPQPQLQNSHNSQSSSSDPTQRRLSPRQRAAEAAAATANNSTPNLTERAKIKNEVASKAPEHVVWLREMYRDIDLEKDDNAALYYPVTPIGDRMNLFSTIFKLLADNKIVAYNYPVNGTEVFTDKEKLNFEDGVLKKFQIPYKKEGTDSDPRYTVDDADIPSIEVSKYQIKEGWYFDAATGTYKSQVIAICPLLVRKDYNIGDVTNNPVCWIPYENLRPYLSRTMIMTSNYNNVLSYSIDDFFTKGMYKGDIIKTVNMKDQSLAQQVGDDPEKLKHAQDSIENQLKTFKERLWVQPDTTQASANNKSVKKVSTRGTTTTAQKESSPKEEKPKAVKAAKTSTTPTKTVRRTR